MTGVFMSQMQQSEIGWMRRQFWLRLRIGLCLLAVVASAAGCHREHYRRQADREAYRLIEEKVNDPRWALPRVDISVDPRSRMFDPFDPDHEPMPVDDPASHELMHRVDGKPNYPHWDKDGITDAVENPCWTKDLPVDERGVLQLDLDTAVELALLHSPDNQEAYEELYLSALDVSAERFNFDAQLYGGSGFFYRNSGINRGLPRSRFDVDTDLALRRSFIAGGNLVVNFANSLIWDFHGNDSNAAFSLIDFSFVQPFLQGAGRDRVLTRLTLAERQLLANVRQLELYRRGFYLDLATGAGSVRSPRRIGGLFGGSGLEGFTGVGGGFGGVGGIFGGGGGFQDAGAALQVGGFLGLLQDQQNIRNQQTNIAGLRSNVEKFEQTLTENLRQVPEDPTEVVRNRLQVAQARQTLYNQEFALASAQAAYQSRVDQLKIDLGLPPHLCVEIVDPLLDRFNLLDTAIVPLQDEVASLNRSVGDVNAKILAAVHYEEIDGRPTSSVTWSDELKQQLIQLRDALAQIRAVRDELSVNSLPQAQQDIARLKQMLPQRRESLQRLGRKYPQTRSRQQECEVICQVRLPASLDPEVVDVGRLERLPDELDASIIRLERGLSAYEEPLQRLEQSLDELIEMGEMREPQVLYQQLEDDVLFAIPSLLAKLNSDLLDFSLIQAKARTDSIELVPVEMSSLDAFRIASVNRLDWMNARASLVDTWRAIAFVANDLEGVVDLVVNGDAGTVGDNPFDFRSTRSTVRMGLQIDPPFTRLLERNSYRQVLIDYQQARRSYYTYIDRVSQGIRGNIRTLELNELNFEIRRIAVLAAIEQIVLNDEISTLNEERGQVQGVTAARDIVQALSDLQDAQDAFMGVWVTYEVNRRFLDFNLGTMQLDGRGMWIDPGPIRAGQAPFLVPTQNECRDQLLSPDDVVHLERMQDVQEEVISVETLPADESPSGAAVNRGASGKVFRLPIPSTGA